MLNWVNLLLTGVLLDMVLDIHLDLFLCAEDGDHSLTVSH